MAPILKLTPDKDAELDSAVPIGMPATNSKLLVSIVPKL
jgi:hypothetical protein